MTPVSPLHPEPASSERIIAAEVLARFAAIVGAKNTITDPAEQAGYLLEGRGLYRGHTPMILRPGAISEVSSGLNVPVSSTAAGTLRVVAEATVTTVFFGAFVVEVVAASLRAQPAEKMTEPQAPKTIHPSLGSGRKYSDLPTSSSPALLPNVISGWVRPQRRIGTRSRKNTDF